MSEKEQSLENGKRAHHNALERVRRDHIKDSFLNLRDVIPIIHKSKILKKATEYLQVLINQTKSEQDDLEEIQKQNKILEQKILSKKENDKVENANTTKIITEHSYSG